MSHRAAMLAGLSNGECVIRNFLPSEDCLNTLKAMQALGVKVEVLEEMEGFGPVAMKITGRAMRLEAPSAPIDCGNSGTGMRLLAGLLAGQTFDSELFGDESLSSRPMGRVMVPLAQMGARIEGLGKKPGCAPLHIHASKLSPIRYDMPVASAQVKSAVLLAGLFAEGETTVVQPAECRDHTERMLAAFGVRTTRDGNAISICGGQVPEARDFRVPGDISSAAFWIVAAAALPESVLLIRDVGLNPTRTALLGVLVRMGASIQEVVTTNEDGEPSGNLEIRGRKLHGTEVRIEEIPNLIDEIPALAVAGALASGRTVIRNASELRVKETDRIATVVHNLRAMGAEVYEFDDGLEIEGGKPLHGAELDSFGDHRIAMAFAVAGLFTSGETVIRNTACVNTSYPGFACHLDAIRHGKSPASACEAPHPADGGGHVAIAIDGPAASGKSTLARCLAERLGLIMVNSGLMYRAVTWQILRMGVNPADPSAVAGSLRDMDLGCGLRDGMSVITVDGVDPGDALREPAVNAAVSFVAAVPEVRERLVAMQRDYLRLGHVVMEWRDIGTVVFADTPYKIYVDADESVRAARRCDMGEIDSVAGRDKADSARATAPLRVADGAVILDTSNHTIETGVQAAIEILRNQGLAWAR